MQAFRIRPDQDVLTVVECEFAAVVRDFDPAGAATRQARSFKKRDLVAQTAGFDSGRAAGPACTNNGNFQTTFPKAWVFHASQNLRSGVKLTRWCSTW